MSEASKTDLTQGGQNWPTTNSFSWEEPVLGLRDTQSCEGVIAKRGPNLPILFDNQHHRRDVVSRAAV